MKIRRIISFTLAFLLLGTIIGSFISAVRAEELARDDVSSYPTTSMFVEGNYTRQLSAALIKKGLPSNFIGINAKGLGVFSFKIAIQSTTTDTNELDIMNQWDYQNVDKKHYSIQDLFVDDQQNLIENTTDIDGSSEHFEYATSFAAASYPFLWINGMFSSTIGTNSTITVYDATGNTTLLNDYIANMGEFWYDLTESTTYTTITKIQINNTDITNGVYIFNIAIRELKDGRHITNYVGGDAYSGTASIQSIHDSNYIRIGDKNYLEIKGSELPFIQQPIIQSSDLDKFTTLSPSVLCSIPTVLKPEIDLIRARVTSFGDRDQLEDAIKFAISGAEHIEVGDIQDYAISGAKIINSLPTQVQSIVKQFCVQVAGQTSNTKDFIERCEDTTISGSIVINDNPGDEPGVLSNIWNWLKENARKIIDNTKAAITSIINGDSVAEWGCDVTNDVIDAQGRVEDSPTVWNALSDKVFEALSWAQANWYWLVIGSTIVGLTVLVIVLVKRR